MVEQLEERAVPTVTYTPVFGAETLKPTPKGDFNFTTISSAHVDLIFWGSFWNASQANTQLANTLAQDAQTILQSAYLSGLTRYGSDGVAFFTTSVIDSGYDPPMAFNAGTSSSSSKAAIMAEIANAIENLNIPGPAANATQATAPIYVVVTDPNHAGTNGGFNIPGTYTPAGGSAIPINMISVGTGAANTEYAFDETFSHEMAERMSDPTGDNQGVLVNPPAGIPANLNGGLSQIADNEPEPAFQPHYAYRLGGAGGVFVQPYWSNATDNTGAFIAGAGNFIVPDGNSQNITVQGIWTVNNRVAPPQAIFSNTYTLSITGDQLWIPNDTLTIDDTATGTQIILNGEKFFFDPGQIQGINVNLGGGNDTINVESLMPGDPLNISLGNGTDTVNLSPTAKALDNIRAAVTITGGSGNDTLHIMDSSSSPQIGRFYNLENDSLRMPYMPSLSINYSNIANVELDACSQSDSSLTRGNQITLQGQVATQSVTIHGGNSTDVLVVDFSVGSPIPGGGITLDGGAGTNLLMLQGDPYLSLTDTATGPAAGSLTFGNGLISLSYPTITYANVQSISDQATPGSGPFALVNGLTFNAPGGPSDLTISDGQFLYSGMTVISGTAPGGSTPTCATLAFTNRNYATVNSSNPADALTVNMAHAAHGLVGLTVNAASDLNNLSPQSIYVLGTAAGVTTNVNAGHGWHNIFVGLPNGNALGVPGSPLDAIQGPVTVSGQAYRDILDLYDSASTAQKTYTLNGNSISAGVVGGVSSGLISWQGSLSEVALFGSTAADTYLMQALPSGLAAMVVDGAPRANTVRSALAGNHTWWIYPNAGVTLDYGLAAVPVTFGAVWNLTGGPGADQFVFLPQNGHDGHLGDVIDGGGGTNTLDYSHYSTGVTVDLTGQNTPTIPTDPFGGLGAATGTAGVRHIQNLVGSRLNDTLIGDDEPNVIMPNGGWDVVRGNGGDDTVRIWGPQDPRTTIDGGSGANTLWAADFPNTWNVTSRDAGSVRGTVTGYVSGASFSHLQNLLGGTNTDTISFANGAGVSGWVNGNLGVNTLDYTAYTTPVTVNLSQFGTWGRAMNAPQGVMNFQIVLGSRTGANTLTGSNTAASVLVGGAANDVLTAGTARAILIGGAGADVIQGGPADDLLISGTTSYDSNPAALATILAEWGSGRTYGQRVADLRSGSIPGNYRLFWGATVFDDGTADRLTGGPGLDWFFANLGPGGLLDQITDLNNGGMEHVNNN
jgi:hypothetical protein